MDVNNFLNLFQQFAPLLQNLNSQNNNSPFNMQNSKNQKVNQFDNRSTQKCIKRQQDVSLSSYPNDTIDNPNSNKLYSDENKNKQNNYINDSLGLNLNHNANDNCETPFHQSSNQIEHQNTYNNNLKNNIQNSFQSQNQNLSNSILSGMLNNLLGGINSNANANSASILSTLMGFLGKNNDVNGANILSSIMQKKDTAASQNSTTKISSTGLIKKFSKVNDVEIKN